MTDEELAVLQDQMLERGEAQDAGALGGLVNRGLDIELTHGFPTTLLFNLGASLVRDSLEQWANVVLEDGALRFVRRIELHLTPDVHSFAPRAAAMQAKVLANPPAFLRSFEIIELDEPAFEEEDHVDEARLFEAPKASSWFTEDES